MFWALPSALALVFVPPRMFFAIVVRSFSGSSDELSDESEYSCTEGSCTDVGGLLSSSPVPFQRLAGDGQGLAGDGGMSQSCAPQATRPPLRPSPDRC
eukprot:3106387-Pyramimonas_sp.AAC.1